MARTLFPALAALILLASPAAATLLTVTADDCAALTAYAPSDDIAYQPGVDANGNAVVSADLNSAGQLDFSADDVIISIDIPLRATAGVVGDEAAFIAAGGQIDTFGANAGIGTVTLRDGDVYFNGQRISDYQQRAIAVACAEQQGN